MSGPDFLTVDAFHRPPGGRLRWRRDLKRTLDRGIDGLRGATVNYANNGTHALVPALLPGGSALVAAWASAEAAEAAFAGPLRRSVDGSGRFSLDAEIVRVRIDSESERDHWHGWAPSAEGAEPLADGEPMVAVVHGILRRGRLLEFVRNNVHAASRAAHHPGHRGSIDISSDLPFEHTSISLWKTFPVRRPQPMRSSRRPTASGSSSRLALEDLAGRVARQRVEDVDRGGTCSARGARGNATSSSSVASAPA
jgi:hypothetical protein